MKRQGDINMWGNGSPRNFSIEVFQPLVRKKKRYTHDKQVENRINQRGMWEQSFGPNYREIVATRGALEEEYQACIMLRERGQEPEITWGGGGRRGCTLDFGLLVDSYTIQGKKYELTCKMDKVIEEHRETDRLDFKSLEYSNAEKRWKNITRLEGPTHTEIAAKMYIFHEQNKIIDHALEKLWINKRFTVDPIFPKDSLQEILDNNFMLINPIYKRLCHKERKAPALTRHYILYALTDAVRKENWEKIDRLNSLA